MARAGDLAWPELAERYGGLLMEGLEVMATRGRHANVLQHLMGFLKTHITPSDKQDLLRLIED